MLVNTKYDSYSGYYDDTIYVFYEGDRLLKGDIVELWGNSTGLVHYTSTTNVPVTIPSIKVLYVNLIKKRGASEQVSSKDLLTKTSGFTLDECNELCDMTYDIQAQVDMCQGNCAMIGKEGASMDKICLQIIGIYNKKHNTVS